MTIATLQYYSFRITVNLNFIKLNPVSIGGTTLGDVGGVGQKCPNDGNTISKSCAQLDPVPPLEPLVVFTEV